MPDRAARHGLLALAVATVLVAAAPPVVADHGENAHYLAQAGPCSIFAAADYDFGAGHEQTWTFAFWTHGCDGGFASDDCIGFGSIEAGFTSMGCDSGADFHVGGTGVHQACCPDTFRGYAHPLIEVAYAGFAGEGVAFVHN